MHVAGLRNSPAMPQSRRMNRALQAHRRNDPSRYGASWWPFAGAVLLAHFAITCAIKASKGITEDVLWLSHISLVVAGLGLVMRNPMLFAAALTGILFTHGMWLFDLFAWLLGYGFPLSISEYMADAPFSTWVSTGHHLYLLPLLLWIVLRTGRYPWRALPAIIIIFAVLAALSRLFTGRAANVNCAYVIDPTYGVFFLDAANRLSGAAYVLALIALMTIIFLLPAAILLRMLTALIHGRGKRDEYAHGSAEHGSRSGPD
jgi:hypothetical protein